MKSRYNEEYSKEILHPLLKIHSIESNMVSKSNTGGNATAHTEPPIVHQRIQILLLKIIVELMKNEKY